MNILKKLQQQSESNRKIILWIIVIIVGLGLAAFWIWNSYREIKEFSKEKFIQELNLPSLDTELEKLPEMGPLEEELKKIGEEQMKSEGIEEDINSK